MVGADKQAAADGATLAAPPSSKTESRPGLEAAPAAAVAALKADEDAADLTMASGASTPFPSKEEQELSVKVSVANLCAKAAAAYSHKEYEKAAELYSQAAGMQAELNGEMSTENAEVLFLYGRSLFKVGQGKSDVLGGKAPVASAPGPEKNSDPEKRPVIQKKDTIQSEAEKADNATEKQAEDKVEGKKALFQFTGDENFDNESDDDEDGEAGEGHEEEEDDDLAVAFEILDLSRILFLKKLEKDGSSDGKYGKDGDSGGQEMTLEMRHVKERLADTYDLLTEISLENGKYSQATQDARKSLAYKTELYSAESEIIAEAHFKVSLALEFASVTQTQEDAQKAGNTSTVDMSLRKEAAQELEAAINSTRLNLKNKEVDLATIHAPEENELTRQRIAEMKEIIADMEQRLEDLRKPPIDLDAAIASGTGAAGGLLGALASSSSASGAAASQQIEEAKKKATDLTGLVRKKEKKLDSSSAAADSGTAAANGTSRNGTNSGNNNNKRKAEEPPFVDAENERGKEESKKARVSDDGE